MSNSLDTRDSKKYDVDVENTAGIAGINARGVRSEVGTDDEPRSSKSEQYNNSVLDTYTVRLDTYTVRRQDGKGFAESFEATACEYAMDQYMKGEINGKVVTDGDQTELIVTAPDGTEKHFTAFTYLEVTHKYVSRKKE